MNYRETALAIIKNIGGVENIAHLEHCSTRLRFTLNDDDQANSAALEKIQGVIGVRQNVQCQVIIGNDVIEVYDEVRKMMEASGTVKSNQHQPRKKQKLGNLILDFIVGIFQPLVPAIAGGGVLKSLLLLLALIGVLDNTGETYQILSFIGDAPLYFLPILVAITTANKLKVNVVVAVSAVAALLLPTMTATLAEGASLFHFSVQNIAYSSQVFPAILCILFYAQMEKFFTKLSPKAIRIFFVPMMSLLITVPVTLLVLGPIGFTVGKGFTTIIFFLFEQFGWVAVALLAAILPFMVVTGMHKAMVPYVISSLGEIQKELLYLPASLAHNISEAGACFAVAVRSKDSTMKSTAVSAGISALFGITEPALYGVTILHKRVLYSVMVGSLFGGAFVGRMAVEAFAAVGPGLASLSMFISEDLPRNIVYALIGALISFAISFVAVLLLWKESEEENIEAIEEKTAQSTQTKIAFHTAIKGQAIPLADVNDEVFSHKIVGEGVAVIPTEGILYAPADGTITMVFDSHHALGMKTENGAELLFHVGLDTVQLAGKYFEPKVGPGDIVQTGDELLRFDLAKIKEAGFDPTTIIVVTNQEKFQISEIATNQTLGLNEKMMTVAQLGNA